MPGSGTLTSLPEDGVSEIPVIVREKASTDVPGGGVRGFAERVRLTVALGSTQVLPEQGFGCRNPVHEPSPRAAAKKANNKRELRLPFIEHLSFGDRPFPMDDPNLNSQILPSKQVKRATCAARRPTQSFEVYNFLIVSSQLGLEFTDDQHGIDARCLAGCLFIPYPRRLVFLFPY